MHELSIAQSIVDVVETRATECNATHGEACEVAYWQGQWYRQRLVDFLLRDGGHYQPDTEGERSS